MLCLYILVEKHAREVGERLRILRGKICAFAAGGTPVGNLGMPFHIVGETFGHYASLTHHIDFRRSMVPDYVVEQRIVGACQYDGIYLAVFFQ